MTPTGAVSVAVDLGNSAAKWSARCDGGQRTTALHRVPLRLDNWPEQIIRAVDDLAAGAAIRWYIAAVNTPARQQLVERLRGDTDPAEITVISRSDIPMGTRLAHPERTGIDRLLALWKATGLYLRQRVIVVDAGSAITIDCGNCHGEFLGGVIIPGLSLQFDSLARGTDALPAIRPPESTEHSAVELTVPATDTVAAIRSGIMLGTAAAIDGLIGHSLAGQPHQVILTGGDALRLSPLVRHPHVVHERLVIDAILDVAPG